MKRSGYPLQQSRTKKSTIEPIKTRSRNHNRTYSSLPDNFQMSKKKKNNKTRKKKRRTKKTQSKSQNHTNKKSSGFSNSKSNEINQKIKLPQGTVFYKGELTTYGESCQRKIQNYHLSAFVENEVFLGAQLRRRMEEDWDPDIKRTKEEIRLIRSEFATLPKLSTSDMIYDLIEYPKGFYN